MAAYTQEMYQNTVSSIVSSLAEALRMSNDIQGGRSILGLPRAWMASHRSNKGVEIGPSGQRKMQSITDSSARALLLAPPTRRVLQSEDNYKHQEVDGFLRLTSSHSRRHDARSHRSITVSRNDATSDSDASDSSHQASSYESSSEEITLTSHQEKIKTLEQEIKEKPMAVEIWLSLLSHTLLTIPLSSKNAIKARSEITVSILSRALAMDPQNGAFNVLRIQYLKAGEEVWHESKVRAEWEEALKIGGADIWMEWIEWRIKQVGNGVDGVVEDAVRMLGAFGHNEQDELAKIRVFWRVAMVFQCAGFVERATSMFQAQAELLFKIPQAIHGLPHETQLDHLENFWESEVPRVGEVGSRGWVTWASGHREDEVGALGAKSDTGEHISELDPYRQWAAQEIHVDQTGFLPSRSSDDTDDPYSTILFSDIRPLLIPLASATAKDAFRCAWLSIVGLHIPGFSQTMSTSNEINWDDRWNLSYLTRRPYLNSFFPSNMTQNHLTTESVAGIIIGREKEYTNPFGPLKCWGHGVLRPLDIGGESQKGEMKAAMWRNEDIEGLDHSFIRRLFAQLRLGATDTDWDTLTLAFEATLSVKSALKQSRALLSQNESLAHWSAHAQLEVLRGRVDDARKIYQTVLTTSTVARNMPGTSNLWWDWVHMEWLNGDPARALQLILRSAGVEGQGGVAVLRCKRGLDDAIKGEQAWKDREGWIKLRALLELLTAGDVTSALKVFDSHLIWERKKGPCRESLLVACLLIVYRYGVGLKNPIPPAVLRHRVEKAMEEYPSNSIILGLFLEGERGQGMWGRVREILGESATKKKDLARRVEEVWIAGWEKGRWMEKVERTRSGLAAAVDTERTKASHVLWRIYIEFEIQAGQLQRAKRLLFRAIGDCPLVKELYLIAFGPLRSVFSGQELRGLGDTMAERGLRLRRGLDEALEGWQGDIEAERLDSDSEQDEIVDNARELRRLMPY
ncbi:hypothetical protein H0H87_009199 [Tephrocybe sp. NHM501043]|nr:hypothetical protein H0H87_009199 [Tephrocybe sp. NHM501043]